jgi:hypothetical protein
VEDDSTHQLNIEMAHPSCPFTRFTDERKHLFELGVEKPLHLYASLTPILRQVGDRGLHPFPDRLESTAQGIVVERFQFRFVCIDGLDNRSHALHIALVLRPDYELNTFLE